MFHLTAAGQSTCYGFAEAALKLDLSAGCSFPTLKVIGTVDYLAPATKPKNSILNCPALEAAAGLEMSDWHDAFKLALEE